MRNEEEVTRIIASDDSQLTPTTPRSGSTSAVAPHTPPPVEKTPDSTPVRPTQVATLMTSTTINHEALATNPTAELTRVLTCTDPVAIVKNKDHIKRSERSGTFTLYTMANLTDLYHYTAKHDENLVRFIVNKNGQLYFAQEGIPNSHDNGIPAHHEMDSLDKASAVCITAGNVRLIKTSGDQIKIDFINHKSGDFRPSFTSLRSFIVILAANSDLLDDVIAIQLLDEAGGEIKNVNFTKDEFLCLARAILAAAAVPALAPQLVDTVTVTRPPIERPVDTGRRPLALILNAHTPSKRKAPEGDDRATAASERGLFPAPGSTDVAHLPPPAAPAFYFLDTLAAPLPPAESRSRLQVKRSLFPS